MRILMCHNSYRFFGGEDQVFADEQWLLRQAGHEVVTLQRSNHELDKQPGWRVALNTVWNRTEYRNLHNLIRRHRPDVVHFHNTFPQLSPAAYYAAVRAGVPVVQTLHNYRLICPGTLLVRDGQVCQTCISQRWKLAAIQHRCYRDSYAASLATTAMLGTHWTMQTWQRAVTRFIALTDFTKQTMVQAGLPAAKIAIKPNFVRPDPGYGSGDGGYAIFVGRLTREKGVPTLLDAWRDTGPMPLKIVGEGPLESDVKRAAQRDDIEYVGFRDHAEVLRLISGAACLVFPSNWHEAFGRCLIEAMACGIPVIATDMAPMNDIVQHESTGLLFGREDPVDLCRQLQRLTESPDLRQSMRRRAREVFLQRYTASDNLQQLMQIYRGAIDSLAREAPHASRQSANTPQQVASRRQTGQDLLQ